MNPVIVLHHHEIVLKGNNRRHFEEQLMKNVRRAIADIVPPSASGGGYGKFIVKLPEGTDADPVVDRLSRVFGIANVCAGLETGQSAESFIAAARALLEGRLFSTLKVDTRRPDKHFPLRSMEVNRIVGADLCGHFGVRARMEEPDETIHIEIVDNTAFVYRSRLRGAGGLPTGVSGRVVALLSAGFDSPVASWKLMKRGASVIFVHFHSMPYTGAESVAQVRRLAELLTRWQLSSKLYLIPFAGVQQEIVAKTPQPLRVILYRRMMLRIAGAIAAREKAEALVTGEAVGQVASQTLRNIRAIASAADLPILRPLAGDDKEETMAAARRLGTFEISREPYDDCCSFLAPRQPATWAAIPDVESAERALDLPLLTRTGLAGASLERFSWPPVALPVDAE